jgi:hypothetical protein
MYVYIYIYTHIHKYTPIHSYIYVCVYFTNNLGQKAPVDNIPLLHLPSLYALYPNNKTFLPFKSQWQWFEFCGLKSDYLGQVSRRAIVGAPTPWVVLKPLVLSNNRLSVLLNLGNLFFSWIVRIRCAHFRCQDARRNDILHNDKQHNDILRYDTWHNDKQHNDILLTDTWYNDKQHDAIMHYDTWLNCIQHNDTQHNDIQYNNTQHYILKNEIQYKRLFA